LPSARVRWRQPQGIPSDGRQPGIPLASKVLH
jgi:hypothetical protein